MGLPVSAVHWTVIICCLTCCSPQMALNLRKKTPQSVPVYVYDVYEPNMHKFAEAGCQYGEIVICGSAKEVAEHSVR
jgi:hypothetical protein